MKIWYITPSTNLMLDKDTDQVERIDCEYTSINECYIAPFDCKIKFSGRNSKEIKEYDVKQGQVVITFYKESLPNQLVILDCPEFLENIQAYKDEVQQEKERWANENKAGCCDACCKSDC